MTPSTDEIEAFLYHEAELLDAKAFDDWLDLLTDDVLYWAPLARGQAENDVHSSLFFEDRLLLRIRVERLKSPRVFSQQPPSFCQHVLQRPRVVFEGVHVSTRAPFFYMETRVDEKLTLSGTVHHELVSVDGQLKIRRKRIELVNRDAALPSIQLLI